ncbi:MAG: hypothetical protein A2Y79_03725 [Deltaproteobacteria bacterium RBG_13_43_22]|nr:MAG: hypothetical protein A2Y79_03725 [Deltaproteobacteria bacterium RBG_13_43_22]
MHHWVQRQKLFSILWEGVHYKDEENHSLHRSKLKGLMAYNLNIFIIFLEYCFRIGHLKERKLPLGKNTVLSVFDRTTSPKARNPKNKLKKLG